MDQTEKIIGDAIDRIGIWPKEEKADSSKLVAEILTIASGTQVEDPGLKEQLSIVEELVASKSEGFRGATDAILDGRLGEIYQQRMHRFPIDYGYLALLAVASSLTTFCVAGRTNLYVALSGGVGTGKSRAIESAIQTLGLERPVLMDTNVGSGEGLVLEAAGAAGNSRLAVFDELVHLLEKCAIEHSSLAPVLCSAFYKSSLPARIAKQNRVEFNCVLSLLGGLVDERFSDAFGAAATAGLYDRFLLALCPSDFRYEYRPHEGPAEVLHPVEVTVDPEVWDCKAAWERDLRMNARIAESAIRAAVICSAFDGRRVLTTKDLGPALELAKYETRVREILRPNSGKNFGGILAHKFLSHLKQNPNITPRELFRRTHAYDLGPAVAEKTLAVLVANDDVIATKWGKTRLLRLAAEGEEIGGEAAN